MTDQSEDTTHAAEDGLLNRRAYLRLTSAAGVIGVGSAAFAGNAGATDTEPQRTLTIEGSSGGSRYRFSVGGDLNKSTAMNASINSNDDLSGNTADGSVAKSGRDSYAFSGEVTGFSTGGDPLLYLNGEPLTDTLTIEDIPEDRRTNYELRVDGEVLKSTAMSASINGNDEITPRDDPYSVSQRIGEEALAGETYALGGVNNGKDSYVVSGEITGFHADGNVTVYLNGEEVAEPARFVRTTLTFESIDGDYASYDFATSGDITKSKFMGATINDNDTMESGGADGAVTGNGRDSYAFTGEITDFSGSDNLRVYLNREEIDKSTLSGGSKFKNTLTIEGNGGRTDYDFAVEGTVKANYGIGDEDTIEGKTATGAVTSGQDSYTFTGDIASFRTEGDGSFTTYLNGNEVDPVTLGETQTTPDADQLPNEVSIRALTNARTEYGIGVSGTLATGDRTNTWSGDNAAYEYARGWVAGKGLDNYKFSGEIRTLTDFETFQIDIDRQNQTIDIEDFDSGGQTNYEIMVSGGMTATSSSSEDSVSGGTATGGINGGTDVYEFTGDIFELTIKDAFTVKPTYKPQTEDIIVANRDDVEHTFSIEAVDTSGSSDQTIMQEDVTVASNEQTTYATVLPVGKESRLDVTLEDGQSASRDATVVGDFPLIYGMRAQVVSEGMGILPEHVDLGPNERRVF